ncbi:muscle M-line assembly protein unc-89-like [Euwallacea fornicatus]|uniref:muscle M-line assembly protein unc-89-like n=1 Tax=Euwallacea fornicatus TaxID=995702 RepID=UPI00338FC70E
MEAESVSSDPKEVSHEKEDPCPAQPELKEEVVLPVPTKPFNESEKKLHSKVVETHKDNEEKGDEDVPEDFFDDFLKEDFMAGLDIVDEDVEYVAETNNEQNSIKDNGPKERTKKDHVVHFKESPSELYFKQKKTKTKRNTKHDVEFKKSDHEPEDSKSFKKTPLEKERNVDADNFDIRRDPEKTRKAIQRDKIKTAKDKEKKLITDIVQTGLVPPGMELEFNMEEVCKKSEEESTDLREISPQISTENSSKKPSPSSITKLKKTPKKRKSKTPRNSRDRSRKRSPFARRSPAMRTSPLLKGSPLLRANHLLRRSPVLRRSPQRYSPPRRRSPRRSRSPLRRRSPMQRRRSRSRSITRRSPHFPRSRSRENYWRFRRDSPLSRRRRSSSRSPKRQRRDEKKSFLEELVAKLNETHPTSAPAVPMASSSTNIGTNFMPVVTPLPQFFTPQPILVAPKPDIYDESFFIGSAPPTTKSLPVTRAPALNVNTQENGIPKPQEATKLYEDKKINLSDFLAITAKPQVSSSSTSSAKLQEKVKVIQRCQDAVKILNERRFSGPLVVQKSSSYACSTDMTMSPLLRKPLVQLPFTTPGIKTSGDVDFKKCCEFLLYRIGIEKRLVKCEDTAQIPLRETPKKDVNSLPKSHGKLFLDPSVAIKSSSKSFSTQTDKELSRCQECLKRKNVLYSNCAVQAGEVLLKFSVSTQVTEADFYSMIPKTQSLASLTPAQLLGKQSMIPDAFRVNSSTIDQLRASVNRLNNAQGRYVPSPPLPPPIPMQFVNPPMSMFTPQQPLPFRHPSVNPPNIRPPNYYNEDRRKWN